MCYLSLLFLWRERDVDVVFCDGVSSHLPLITLFGGYPTYFYCHFPDQLLCVERGSMFKRLYRAIFDWLEKVTLFSAHTIGVNSLFTSAIFKHTFLRHNKKEEEEVKPRVLYPPVSVPSFLPSYYSPSTMPQEHKGKSKGKKHTRILWSDVASVKSPSLLPPSTLSSNSQSSILFPDDFPPSLLSSPYMFLSLNRYEEKKDVIKVLTSFHELLLEGRKLEDDDIHHNDYKHEHDDIHDDMSKNSISRSFLATEINKAVLVIGGGYDERVDENKQVYTALASYIDKHKDILGHKVFLLTSISDAVKRWLLKKSICCCYSPSYEHFGIVPLEAMASGTPVVAMNNGLF